MTSHSEPAAKRRKVQDATYSSEYEDESNGKDTAAAPPHTRSALSSLERSVTPPLSRRSPPLATQAVRQKQQQEVEQNHHSASDPKEEHQTCQPTKLIPSPIQLTRIRELPASHNIDIVSLVDILGDPLIKECWQFNYLFNIDFLMSAFDSDVRSLINVKIIHGSWKRDDPRRLALEESRKRYANVQLITAHMPEPFGTHHSKMMILFRHDDTTQVVIHTANMIPQDWANLCQAVWRSPLLPLLPSKAPAEVQDLSKAPIGSGWRFKEDLLDYLKAYGTSRTKSLCDQLGKYDFSGVRAALVASIPTTVNTVKSSAVSLPHPLWGWPRLKEVLTNINVSPNQNQSRGTPVIVAQVSSIATLGTDGKWLSSFLNTLNSTPGTSQTTHKPDVKKKPIHRIIFPTADTIRRSLDGYASGDSIHMKIQSAAQMKQLSYMRPMLCHWASDSTSSSATQTSESIQVRKAGRRRAAPHIKTYIRFSDETMKKIDWAMVTSANLSVQAWGSLPNKEDEVRICSYEIGVVVWPGLFAVIADGQDDEGHVGSNGKGEASRERPSAVMVPTFKKDTPDVAELEGQDIADVVVGFRMPYDLPLVPYEKADMPWCATMTHPEPDWKGVTWEV